MKTPAPERANTRKWERVVLLVSIWVTISLETVFGEDAVVVVASFKLFELPSSPLYCFILSQLAETFVSKLLVFLPSHHFAFSLLILCRERGREISTI